MNTDGTIYHIPLEEFKVLYNEPIGDEAAYQRFEEARKKLIEEAKKELLVRRPKRKAKAAPRQG